VSDLIRNRYFNDSIDWSDRYPISLLASLNGRASVDSGRGTGRTDRSSSLVFAPGTATSLRLQQDTVHSFQLSETLGRSYKNQLAPGVDNNSRTHLRGENPYRSVETNGSTEGV
jgi:hypothetical protein